ncbi:patched domain-containing protein 3-like [Watersipora subatra]|uniref:patched domain-containing protein 3-like n=1 Tax=Watersipora subatra TaxID=2589382 RepID=UPI00355B2CB8
MDSKAPEPARKSTCLQRAGNFLAGGLEAIYFRLGVAIAKRPVITIISVIVGCLACTAGLVNFYEVDPSDPIWVDPQSMYIKHKQWVDENYPSQLRLSFFIAEAKNVLERNSLLELYDLHDQLINVSGTGYTYEDICTRFGRGSTAECWSTSILELWSFNRTHISLLTSSEILDTINNVTQSPVTNADINIDSYLGGISRDASGRVSAASAALFTYFMQGTNASASEYQEEDEVTLATQAWELEFVDIVNNCSGQRVEKCYALAARSFGDEVGSSILGDVAFLSAGYILIILYVALILGRFNCIEMRVYLAIAAVIAVGLSIAVSFGLSSAFGIGYGPVQSILPFLLLGLGVDDAFVIIQAWNRLTPTELSLPIVERSGRALRHAGVSITVTSITDIVAFGIGATTVLPALRDFCVYATIGIIAVFIVQATFFTACVVLDERRRQARRNGCCCCYVHKETYTPSSCSQRDLQQKVFENFYGPTLLKLPVKIIILLVSLAFLGFGIYGAVFLKQDYDPNVFIPKDSYVKDYVNSYQENFPELGVSTGYIYTYNINYYEDHSKISDMVESLEADPSVDGDSVDSWLHGYTEWLESSMNVCPWIKSHVNLTTKWPLDERRFNMLLTPYVYMSADGRRHIQDVKFNETDELSDDAVRPANTTVSNFVNANLTHPNLTTPEILDAEKDFAAKSFVTTRIPLNFVNLKNSKVKVKAMDDTRAVVKQFYTDDQAFIFSRDFETWETDKVIQQELYKNLGLAFGCVIILTLFLIADVVTCALVSACVLATLVEVAGFMYFLGLTIDTVTCIEIVLSIGLAVDYSAHIGHSFMTVNGSKQERALKTLGDIGPAVFNGGVSTFLAFVLLANSNSYVFDVFFQVNLLVVALGLWNGLVLLPVLLSLLGPPPYLSVQLNSPPSSSLKISDLAADNPAIEAEVKVSNDDTEAQKVVSIEPEKANEDSIREEDLSSKKASAIISLP